ncbi:MAG TPA: acetolactate decarboxylase [Syntrophales bacterium]|nr:acetolactate decarboxylase [Syntrophales bacterium]HQN78175.1 acetolactate decarboxylase [Syntrophales bacterium]
MKTIGGLPAARGGASFRVLLSGAARRTAEGLLPLILVLFLLSGCATFPGRSHTVTQISTIEALLVGGYDGFFPLDELGRYGDFGIGTFDRLDGEMIVLDGKVYQVPSCGKVAVPGGGTTPYAAVVPFRADRRIPFPSPMGMEELLHFLDGDLANLNLFYGIRIDGTFSGMKVRSVPPQEKPYPPLAEATKHQAVFTLDRSEGTIVGFRSPAFLKGVGVPGYHLHYIDGGRVSGGHILDFVLEAGEAQIAVCNRFFMVLPEGGSFGDMDLGRDRSRELEEAERSRKIQ